jgi:hypothetical protein
MKKSTSILLCTIILCSVLNPLKSQLSLTGQLRTRTEIRDGTGNLVPQDARKAAFTSQRTRLNFGYKWDKLSVGVSLQDTRVWGQDASTISSTDGNRLMLHEAWADLILTNKTDTTIAFKLFEQMSIKIGRQELVYDDSRLIGNLYWLQQVRRHDMALLKILHHGWQFDLGYAFNQNTDAFGTTGTSYVPGNLPAYTKNSMGVMVPVPAGFVPLAAGGNPANNSTLAGTAVFSNPVNTNAASQNYKSFTSVYISRKFKQTKFSFLFFNDNFEKYRVDSVGNNATGLIYGKRFVSAGSSDVYDYSGTQHRYTYGLMIDQAIDKIFGADKFSMQAAYYHQSGNNRDGLAMDASHCTIAATYQKGKFSVTPGYDVLSGNDALSPSGKDNRFDPLYGTPHKFRGSMDYFYAGTGSPQGGLNNAYIKFRYTAGALILGADFHNFTLNKDMKKADGTVIGKQLGKEADLQLNYNMNRFTNIELGYSIMSATSSMPFAKAQATTDAVAATYRKTGYWFYTMLKFTPDFLYAKPVAKKQ